MLLRDLLNPLRIRVPIEGKDKSAVLQELVRLLANDGGGEYEDILRAVEEREAVLSTGIGHGVAIPHGKSGSIRELRLVAGASPAPVPFNALDGQPVRLFFLLVGPESSAGDHVKALSRISRLVRREPLRERLMHARSPNEFYQVLCEAESQ